MSELTSETLIMMTLIRERMHRRMADKGYSPVEYDVKKGYTDAYYDLLEMLSEFVKEFDKPDKVTE